MKFRQLCLATVLAAALAPVLGHEYYAKTFKVIHPWSEATGAGQKDAAVYLSFEDIAGGDRLLAASTSIAEKVEVRGADEAVLAQGIVVPGEGSFALRPGDAHLTLVNLKAPLLWGRSYPVTLQFEKSGPISVMVSIGAH